MRKMKSIIILLMLLTICSCSTIKLQKAEDSNRMKFTVSKIRNEMDGQTIFLKDKKGDTFITVISIANGNYVDLEVGDEISLIAKEITGNESVQIISENIKIIKDLNIKIATDKNIYEIGKPIKLSMEVENISKESFTFLPWGTPIENSFTNDFLEISLNGKIITYTGIMVKRMAPTKQDYIKLKKGNIIEGNVDISDGYKLTEKGIYTIQFKGKYRSLPKSNIIKIEVR